jgi:hypothetical protein
VNLFNAFFCCCRLETGLGACHVHSHFLDHHPMGEVVEDDKGRIEQEDPDKHPGPVV